jgi:hypothetical protein
MLSRRGENILCRKSCRRGRDPETVRLEILPAWNSKTGDDTSMEDDSKTGDITSMEQ